MFAPHDSREYIRVLDGIQRRTLVHGAKTLLCEFSLKGGCTLPHHTHPHEQTGYLVSGHIRLTIGDDIHDVEPGGSWCIPGGVVHGATILRDSVAVEIFAPTREDYLPD